jgi:cytochrome P450
VSATPPGPRGHFALGQLVPFRHDPLGTLRAAWLEFGDVVYFRGPLNGVFLANPRDVAHVMDDAFANYPHPKWFNSMFAVSANGLVAVEGDQWRRLRAVQEPELTSERVRRFAPIALEQTAALVARWRSAPGVVDAVSEMRDLSHAIIGRVLFGADWEANAAVLAPAADVFLDHTGHKINSVGGGPPEWVPTAENRRWRRARQAYDEVFHRLLRERRARSDPGDDYLGALCRMGLSDREVRENATTAYVAGHITVHLPLAWLLQLVAEHPDVGERLRSELGDRPPALEDLPRLTYVDAVVRETLRLYPPLALQARTPLRDDVIGGHRIPKGVRLFISSYVSHRHPDYWDEPERFDPDRFLDGRAAERAPYAWFPFALGPRECIGVHFALLELRLIVATLAQAFRFEPHAGRPATTQDIALRPVPGVSVRVYSSTAATTKQT